MSVTCSVCGTDLPEDSPGAIAIRLESALNWTKFESDDNRWGQPVGSQVDVENIPGDYVTVEAKKMKPTMEDIEDGFYAGESEYPQGTEYTAYVVLRHGDNFYIKTGTADSYGDINWDSPVRPTKPKQITVTAWE